MSKNIRIRTEPNSGQSQLKVQLNQDFDFLEILSLKIRQEDVYRNFYSDYGVVIGRVVMNGGVGIPNAKVSVFIPLTDEDAQDVELAELYPYSDISVVNSEGIRYNLLPEESQGECHTPVGTFPSKNKLIDNDKLLEIYDKYYKYSTTTNDSGDFMIFGVPVGNHLINVDVDLSDIGIFSQRPYDFIEQGNPPSLFTSPSKFKDGKNLNNLTQLRNRQMGINVIPFWGENLGKEVGFSRVDVDMNYTLEPKAIFMGALFGDNEKNSVNKNCRPRKKLGKICEMSEGGGTIQMIRKDIFGDTERFDIGGGQLINDNGAWAYQIPMNLDYMVTDESGKLIPTEDTNKGIPTRASVRFKMDYQTTGGEGRVRTTAKHLVPHNPKNSTEIDYTFNEKTSDKHFRDFYWNKIYTVKNHIARYQKSRNKTESRNFIGFKDVDDCIGTKNPLPFNTIDDDWNPLFSVLCIIIDIIVVVASVIAILKKTKLPCNGKDYNIKAPWNKGEKKEFKQCMRFQIAQSLNVYEMDFYNDWINGSLYAFLLKYKNKKGNEKFCGDSDSNDDYYLINTNTGSYNVNGKDSQPVKINEGVVVSFENELFYKPMSRGGNLMYATDIFNLGSVFDCDWQGLPKLHEDLIPTTYQFPESDAIDLLFDLECIDGVEVSTSDAINIKRICEIGVDLDDNDRVDEADLEDSIIRNKLLVLNDESYKNVLPTNIDAIFDSNEYISYRDIDKVVIEQSFGNSYYFYFGPSPNKTALHLMNSKYFPKCYTKLVNEIIITGDVYDVTTISGSTGSITAYVNGGAPEYTYVWWNNNNPSVILSTTTTEGKTDTLSGLTEGSYTLQVTDSNDRVNEKIFIVDGVKPLQISVSTRGSLPNLTNDGIIYVNSISGGVGPYIVEISGPGGPYLYEGVNNGVTVQNLANGTYTIVVTDTLNYTDTETVSINELSTLNVTSITTENSTCGENGSLTFSIQGGTPNYIISLTNSDESEYRFSSTGGTTTIDSLNADDYTLVVSDSYNQETLPQLVTIFGSPALTLSYNSSNNTFTLNNTISGQRYTIYRDYVAITTKVASGTSMTYTTYDPGDYYMTSEDGCLTTTITI